MASLIDLTGRRVGKLTFIERSPNLNRATRWVAQCDCGSPPKVYHSHNVLRGNTVSCGCLRQEGKSKRAAALQAEHERYLEAHRAEVERTKPERMARRKRKQENRRLVRVRGITLDDYDRMYAAQDGRCAICREINKFKRRFHVDHCHATGRVRSLLCNTCNTGLGSFRDRTDLMLAAVQYLNAHKTATGDSNGT
jgi:hypothetical protein